MTERVESGRTFVMIPRFHDSESTPEPSGIEPEFHPARRATIEDLPALQALWQGAGLPWDELERYVTEFVVVPDEGGVVLAAIGLQITDDQGLLHSEAISPRGRADETRQVLWQRLQIVARNQGVCRLWTLEDAPFWSAIFLKATPEEVAEMGTPFADPSGCWWTHQLLDPKRTQQLLDERLALWEANRQSESTDLAESIQKIRRGSYAVAGAIILMMGFMVLYVLLRRPGTIQEILKQLGSP